MNDHRPDPDALLAQVQAGETARRRGGLKVFFGYAAGVGKTYAMLENAHRAKAEGRHVVVGYLEPHARPATQSLLAGLERLPTRSVEHRGIVLQEFDVDAALKSKPDVLLVDELAHTNAPGSRHQQRWQDVQELREAGITVWTTLNVQHMESLNDVISQITGITVRETVPDQVFDGADELELVDITPEELLERLQAGKIYLPEQAQRALQSFFQRSNLTALRELSLRQAARRVHTDVESARREQAARRPWATAERLLVCVGPSPTTTRVIRTACRMADAFEAPWLAVSVDVTGRTDGPAWQQIAQHFRLAERLGAETATLTGHNVAQTLLDYARSRNVTRILIGKTRQPRWKRMLRGTVVDDVLEQSGDIDVDVIQGEEEPRDPAWFTGARHPLRRIPYLAALGGIAVTGLVAAALRQLQLADAEANTVMLFLAAVVGIALRYGKGPAVLASIVAVALFDVAFVPPYYTFAVADAQYLVTFAVMLAVGLLISTQTARLKSQVEATRHRERHTAVLYELGKQLSSLSGTAFLAEAVSRRIAELIGGEVVVYLRTPAGLPELVSGAGTSIARHPVSLPAAQWVLAHDQLAGSGTNTLPGAAALFLPIPGSQQTRGVLGVQSAESARLQDPELRRLLEACARHLALALDRNTYELDAANSRIQAETERVRSSLLSSVSHDLKTPLAAIAGASSSLLETEGLDEPTRRQLLETVAQEAARLNRLLENILQMSRLEAGAAIPNRQWHVLEDIVGSALHRTQQALSGHEIRIALPPDLPLILVDGLLLEQVFVNLLENAARHTPAGTVITFRAAVDGPRLRICLADNGPGFPAGSEERIFEKFYRAASPDAGPGSGLGLAICRAILLAHGGSIAATNQPGGGAEFVVTLPISDNPPQVRVDLVS